MLAPVQTQVRYNVRHFDIVTLLVLKQFCKGLLDRGLGGEMNKNIRVVLDCVLGRFWCEIINKNPASEGTVQIFFPAGWKVINKGQMMVTFGKGSRYMRADKSKSSCNANISGWLLHENIVSAVDEIQSVPVNWSVSFYEFDYMFLFKS